jgi:hypothetical protein
MRCVVRVISTISRQRKGERSHDKHGCISASEQSEGCLSTLGLLVWWAGYKQLVTQYGEIYGLPIHPQTNVLTAQAIIVPMRLLSPGAFLVKRLVALSISGNINSDVI